MISWRSGKVGANVSSSWSKIMIFFLLTVDNKQVSSAIYGDFSSPLQHHRHYSDRYYLTQWDIVYTNLLFISIFLYH